MGQVKTDALKVSFSYPSRPERLALNNVTMFFPAGDLTFIVGKSGSGKSTISSLLLGFYTTTGGLTLDREPIQLLDKQWLCNNIMLMQQQPVLFNETILKNVVLGCKNHETVSLEDVEECLRFAALEETVSSLPDGVQTLVGVGGNAMSGGQRQRIALARAKLRDTPILILDETTSALDPASAKIIMDGVREWRQHKTTIIITHDLSQVLPDDYLYILEHGQVVQEGYQRSLDLSVTGPFANLVGSSKNIVKPLPSLPASAILHHDNEKTADNSPRQSVSSISSEESKDIVLPQRTLTMSKAYLLMDRRAALQPNARYSLASVAPHLKRMSSAPVGLTALKSPQLIRAVPMEDRARQFSESEQNFKASLEHSAEMLTHKSTLDEEAQKSPEGRRQFLLEAPVSLQFVDSAKTSKKSLKREEITGSDVKLWRSMPLRTILGTVWPNLTRSRRMMLLMGVASASVHAAATPVFSWVFSQLLGTYFNPGINHTQAAMKWSLAILAVATIDALASYFMHFFLETCGQSWIDSLRSSAYERILDQPRSWFDQEENTGQQLTECLDRNAEEMRNLIGRFAGFVFVAAIMTFIAVVWSIVVCWKLTLVGLATTPFMYGLSRLFEAMNGRWEKRCNDAAEVVSAVFTETFGNIRTVRALTLEDYFHHKHAKTTVKAMMIGMKKAIYSGIFFGASDAGVVFIIGTFSRHSSFLELTSTQLSCSGTPQS